MKAILVLGLALMPLPAAAQSDFLQDKPDCAFFESSHLNGAFWTSQAFGKDPLSSELTPWWQDKASSVWLKHGYVLEAYSLPGFQGTLLSFSESSQAEFAQPLGFGTFINFEDVGFDNAMSSYRCRPEGQTVYFELGGLQWMDAGEYKWSGGGNHPDQRSLKFGRQMTDFAIFVHADSTYGIYKEDYHLNLTREILSVDIVHPAGNQHLEFNLHHAPFTADAAKYMSQMIAHLKIIQAGTPDSPYSLEAPKPELLSLIHYLEFYVP